MPLGTFNASTNINWESTARARVGYANDNWLLYGTGGLALLGAKTTLTTAGSAAICGGVVCRRPFVHLRLLNPTVEVRCV